jgi:sugar fermentation stimulation protein A
VLYCFTEQLREGIYLGRSNRFVVEVLLDETVTVAHLPNSGRLTTVLSQGAACWLRPVDKQGRKTKFDLVAISTKLGTVLVDSQLPNILVQEAWRRQRLSDFLPYRHIQPEYRQGASRFDLALTGPGLPPCLVEVKSAADFQGDWARFPDAPSERAAKHMRELSQAATDGQRAAVIFLAQMPWAKAVVLNQQIDRQFVETAKQALDSGVQLLAYTIIPKLPQGIDWGDAIPVLIP